MVVKDEWTRAAMSDDVLVVELLLRLKESRAASSSSSLLYQFTAKSVIPGWGLRLPRSKASASSSSRCDAVWRRNNKKDDSTRCSPTTPLSWSGGSGGSPSGTADGFEESSRPRSKVSLSHSLTLSMLFAFLCLDFSLADLFSVKSLFVYRLTEIPMASVWIHV